MPKGYNNTDAWDKIQSQNLTTQKVMEEDTFLDTPDDNDEIYTEVEEIQPTESTDDFSDVLQLTQYSDQSLVSSNTEFVVAEYADINTTNTGKKHELVARKFVGKITKFVLDFNDVVLSEEHKNYLKQVANLQLQHLSDLLYLTDVNKQMLNNIIARVNATQAEDYAIISSYNNLANQHLKLIKELQNTYRAIPSVLKKMKADILCNQQLEEGSEQGEEVMTSDFGETQYNNQKQMLRTIIEKNQLKHEAKKDAFLETEIGKKQESQLK